jgi:transcriptional regulator with XRE-family HTH domain/Zn-dependent peptidase ImmA (M78 family)
MFGRRLQQLRLARGLSLEALAARLDNVVTKQAISKYEQCKARPSPAILNKLAVALGVKAMYLWSEPPVQVEFIAYRKGSGLLRRDQAQLESLVSEALEARVGLQDLLEPDTGSELPVRAIPVHCLEDAEKAAADLRDRWKIGMDPICSMIGVLEDHAIHVIEIATDRKFDGLSAIAHSDGRVKAAAVVSRRDVPGERQRLSLAHELGHLALRVASDVDEEGAAFRFGGAMLSPAPSLYREVGRSRSFISASELLLLKQRYGMSIQALVRRLRDLGIIAENHYVQWCRQINSLQWRLHEPMEMPAEQPMWLRRSLLRATAEGLLTKEEAEAMQEKQPEEQVIAVCERRAFAKLPLSERRRLLALQAEKAAASYESQRGRDMWQGGDFLDYAEPDTQAG